MLTIIGFEGHATDDDPCTYGAAAVSDGVFVYNLVTGAKSPIEKWNEYVQEGVVTAVTPHAPLIRGSHPRGDFAALPCLILRAHRRGPSQLLFDTWIPAMSKQNEVHCLESWSDEKWKYWLWPSFEALKAFMRPMAAEMRRTIYEFQIASKVLDPWDGMTQEEYVETLRAKDG